MRIIGDNTLSVPTFTVDDIKDDSITEKQVLERLVKNMVLVKNGIYLQDIYDVVSFQGALISSAKPVAIEVD